MRKSAQNTPLICVVALCALLGMALQASAGWLGAGCWNCVSSSWWNANKKCSMVGNQENGAGTDCYAGDMMGEWCYTNGVACYNTEVNGGGGGGGGTGGSGGSTCTVAQSAACPAECFSCQRTSF